MPIELTDSDVYHRLYAVLNYTAEKDGLTLMEGGFLYVDDILKTNRFSNVKLEQIKRVARQNENFGTQYDLENGRLKIRFQSNEDIWIRKRLNNILRHQRNLKNLKYLRPMTGGFLFLDHVLRHGSFEGVNPGKIVQVAKIDRMRFTLEKDVQTGRDKIRANFGHTMPIKLTDENVKELLLRALKYTDEIFELELKEGGFLYVDELLKTFRFRNVNLDHIKSVASRAKDIETKFDSENGRLKIRLLSFTNEDNQISIKLNDVLHHQANSINLRPMAGRGLIQNDDSRHRSLKGGNSGRIQQLVATDDTKRFSLQKDLETGRENLHANYGHKKYIELTDEHVKRLLFRVLKYTDENDHLNFMDGGFIYVDEILKSPRFSNVKLEQIKRVARSNRNLDTQCDLENGRLKIRFLSDEYIKLSKSLTRLLRHEAYDLDLEPMTGGFLFLDDVLGVKMFKGVNSSMIRQITSDDRKRFTLERDFDTGREKIRANYGHSMYIELTDEDVEQLLFTVLKHTYEMCDLELMDGGFLYVDEILKTHSFSNVKLEQIQRVVRRTNQLETQSEFGSGRLRIRLLSSPNDDIQVLSAEDEDYRITKSLIRLLRHDAYSYNLRPMTGGFLFLDYVLCVKSLKGVNPHKIRQIVKDDKIRFTLKKDVETGREIIRANYGHSMSIKLTDEHVKGLLFKALNNPAKMGDMELMEGRFLYVEDLLNTHQFRNVELDQIKYVVGKSEEFELQSDLVTERLKIRIKL